MATAYTSLLGLALPVTGELAGTWGDTVNNSITSLLDSAVSGTTTLSTDADVTLTTTTGASNQARQAILLCSGARTVLRNITAPAQSKLYVVINSTTGGFGVKIRGVGPTTGVTVAAGKTAVVVWNGSDFVEVAPATATTATNLAGGVAGSLPYQTAASTTTFLGIGAANYVLTSTGTAPTWTINTGTGNVVRATSPTITTPTITTSATVPLLIGGTATTSTLTLRSTSGVGTTGADIIFQTGNNGATEAMRVLNSGNVGIGTTAPSAKLEVLGSTRLTTGVQGAIRIGADTNATTVTDSTLKVGALCVPHYLNAQVPMGLIAGASNPTDNVVELGGNTGSLNSATQIRFYTAATTTTGIGTERLRIDSAGNVGVGTNAPTALLQVQQTLANTYASTSAITATPDGSLTSIVNLAQATDVFRGINFSSRSAAGDLQNSYFGAVSTATGNSPIFVWGQRTGATAYAERMRITSAGDVGIGTTSPTSTLTVAGSANVTGNTTLGDVSTDTVTVNGYMGVGGAPNAAIAAFIQNSALTGATQEGVRSSITATSGATTASRGFYARPTTAAAAFTLADLVGFYSANPTKGAGSTITNQHGLYVEDQTQGTNNYGITSLVSSGTNKWNIYASGSAANYFAGQTVVGTSASLANVPAVTHLIGINNTGANPKFFFNQDYTGAARSATNVGGLIMCRSRGATVDDMTVVNNGDSIGALVWRGSDGTNFVNSVAVTAIVNGAPAATSVPGALSFSTTAVGSSGVTERMRIDSAGNVGIGTSTPGCRLEVVASAAASIPAAGAVSTHAEIGVGLYGTSFGTLGSGRGYIQQQRTDGTATTYDLLLQPNGGALGVGTTNPLNAVRLHVEQNANANYSTSFTPGTTPSQLVLRDISDTATYTNPFATLSFGAGSTGAGFSYIAGAREGSGLSFLAFGTGTGGQATERMRINSTGNVGIGTTSPTSTLTVAGSANVTGNTTLGDVSTDTVTVNGYMGVGGAPNAAMKIAVLGSGMTGTSQYGINVAPQSSSAATSTIRNVSSTVVTEAAAFTCANAYTYLANDASKGAGSSITNLYGLYVADQTQGTNNYGITSLVSSGTNKWNIYASGTAANYFAGQLLLGTTTSTTISSVAAQFQIRGATAATSWASLSRNSADANSASLVFGKERAGAVVVSGDTTGSVQFAGFDGTNYITGASISAGVDGTPGTNDMPGRLVFSTTADGASSPTERMRIDSAGNVGIGTATPVNALQVNGSFGRNAPVTKAASFTLAATENWLICNGTATITVTLPAASSWTGREVMIKTIAAFTVVSASSNVVPLVGGAAGTAILAATAGKFATLVSDGTNWIIMQGN